MTTSGRHFLNLGIALWAASLVPSASVAAEPAELEESDPKAVALGCRKDATADDIAKFPKRAGDAGAGWCNARIPVS